jgi:hypothetical protein
VDELLRGIAVDRDPTSPPPQPLHREPTLMVSPGGSRVVPTAPPTTFSRLPLR